MICHDCQKELKKDASYMPYMVGDQKFAKCKPCYESDHLLRNYKKTEVYSRVVGFHRPVDNWNDSKQEEFKNRKVYKDASNFHI